MEPIRLLTIVVNFHSRVALDRCLHSLLRAADGRFNHEVVIWENGTDHDLGGIPLGAKKKCGTGDENGITFHYWGGRGNLGYARGVTTAYEQWMAQADSPPDSILCANPDTVSSPDAISLLHMHLAATGWGAVAPRMTFEDGRPRPSGYPAIRPSHIVVHFLRLALHSRRGSHQNPNIEAYEVPAVDGAYVLFDHKAWLDVGGLDPMFGLAADDHDVCARLRGKNWRIGVVNCSHVMHIGGTSRPHRPIVSRLDEIQAAIRYASKHHTRGALLALRLGVAAVLRVNGESHGAAMAWWAIHTPTEIAPVSPDIEANYLHALRTFHHKRAHELRNLLETEHRRPHSLHTPPHAAN